MKVPALVGMMRGSGRGRCFGFRMEGSPSNLTFTSSAWGRKQNQVAQSASCASETVALKTRKPQSAAYCLHQAETQASKLPMRLRLRKLSVLLLFFKTKGGGGINPVRT